MCNYPDTEHGTSSTRTHTHTCAHTHTHTHSGKIGSTKSSLGKSWRAEAVACVWVCVCVGMCKWVSKHNCVHVCAWVRSGRGRPLLPPSLLLPSLLLLAWKINNFSIKINTECFFRRWAAVGVPGLGNLQHCVCRVCESIPQCVCVSCVSVCCVLLLCENSLSAWKYATHATSGRVCVSVRQSMLVHVSVYACVCVRACLSLLLLVFWGRLRCLQVNF